MTDRGVSPAVGVVVMVAVVVILASTAAVAFQGAASGGTDPAPRARLELSAGADGRVTLTHVGGDPLDARDLRVKIAVDGRPLAHQPPVPFFASEGFRGGPTGPFNLASDPEWTAGETAGVQIAATNRPTVSAGSTVRVRVYAGDHLVWEGSTTASANGAVTAAGDGS